MKRLYALFVMSILLVVQGCNHNELDNDPALNEDLFHKVEISGNIDQQVTRVDSKGFCDGDAVGIYLVNYDGETPGTLMLEDNQADNVKFLYDGENNVWISEYDVFYKDNDTKVDFYGYYPYSTPSSIEEYPFEVAKDQSKEAEHGQMAAYEASDFLWAKTAAITPTASKVNLKFHHKMASARVRFIQGEGWESEAEFAAVKKEVLVTNTIRKSNINLSTGVVTPVGDMPLDGIIPVEDNGEFRAIVVPQSVEAGKEVLVITIDGYPRKYVSTETTEYLPGKITNFDLTVKKLANTGKYEIELVGVSITAWEADNVSHKDNAIEYVVVNCPVAGSLERTMVDRYEMDVTAIKNLKLTGKIGTLDYEFMREKMTNLMRLNLREVESEISGQYIIPNSAFSGKKTLMKCILPEKLERIESSAFSSTSLTGSLQLPEGLKYVSGFYGTKITSVEFPSTLEEIGDGAFSECTSMMCEISLPESLKSVGNNAFEGAAIRGALVLPENLEKIGSRAFCNCSKLTGSLLIPKGVKIVGARAFNSCGFTGNLTLHKGLNEIKEYAFASTKFKGELNIPETVTTIGNGAFESTEFSGTLVLPDELISLGHSAFRNCWRLSGIVKITENIISVPTSLFYGCKNIEGIILHKGVEVIENSAFANCYYISSIVCEAKNPPVISSSSFSGVAKDNFTVEVPEASVKQYQHASGWSEFKRIEAHREFGISRNLLRTLNKEHSRKLLLRVPAGEDWRVESAPEWVTVTPASGTGKTDVTITVNTLAKDSGNRNGEVVFLLDGKEYRSKLAVEQYDYEYGDGDLIKHQGAKIGNGVNIVLMGDCFDAKDIAEGNYLLAMEQAYEYFFDIEPYKTYKEYFNVYSVVGMSYDSGMGTVNTIRESRFGSQYTLNEGVSPDFETVFAGACVAPINNNVATTLIVLVENSAEYSGLCYMWGDGSAVAVVPMSTDPAPYDFQGLIHHEAGGHGFGKLADEYIYHNAFIQSCTCLCCGHVSNINSMKSYGFFENISLTGNMVEVPWAHFIYDPQYSNVVDVYEGAYMHSRGVFRSEVTSCMNNNIAYYNAISREAMVKRIMKYSGESYSFEEFKANDKESLPETSAIATRAWDGVSVGTSSQFSQREPKFMGEKPSFDINKF